MFYLYLTNFERRDANSATWIISSGEVKDVPGFFHYQGRLWNVKINYNPPPEVSTVKCSASPVINDLNTGDLNKNIRLSIVDNSSNVKLWTIEKKVQLKSFSPSSGLSQLPSQVLETNLEDKLIDRLRHTKCLQEKKLSLVMEFLPVDFHSDKIIVEDSQSVTKQSETRPKEVVSTDNDWKELSENILSLLLNEDDCDVTLNVAGRSFKAHRTILSSRSPVFDRMFKHDLEEKKTGTVDIPDCDPGAFEAYLHYLYSGNFDTITVDNVSNIYRISDKYGSKTLVRRCLRFMMDNLFVDKFGEFVSVILDDLESSSFLEAAIRFFADNLEGIGESEAWKKFLEHKPFQANDLMIKAYKNFASRHKK